MSNFMIDLSDEEIKYVYLAIANTIRNNTNEEAVEKFRDIMDKLEPYVSDSTKMTATIMQAI